LNIEATVHPNRGKLWADSIIDPRHKILTNMMKHVQIRRSALLIIIFLTGCAGGGFGPTPTKVFPTFDPILLSATPAPSVTPAATYTPFPTAERLASATPFPTYAPLVTLAPYTPPPAATSTPAGGAKPPTSVPATATAIIGVPGIGPDRPELAAILTFPPNARCNEWYLAQIGIVNRGTGAARNFDVQWSFGYGEPVTTHVDELQWFAGPLLFFSGQTAVQCSETVSLTAWIKIDINNTVDEAIEDNNSAQQTYTVTFESPITPTRFP
jgi:hypothetical protein